MSCEGTPICQLIKCSEDSGGMRWIRFSMGLVSSPGLTKPVTAYLNTPIAAHSGHLVLYRVYLLREFTISTRVPNYLVETCIQ